MRIETKKCECCGEVHEDLNSSKVSGVVDLAKFYQKSKNPFRNFGITHQFDCVCGSTLYAQPKEVNHD